jgi:phosphodiesterase/alkaline phosphatase D-like protein
MTPSAHSGHLGRLVPWKAVRCVLCSVACLVARVDWWEGYAVERDALLRLLREAPVRNLISFVGEGAPELALGYED